jgi:hypothetical protein
MHFNPCTERWRLCEKPCEFDHSSAAFYQIAKQGKIQLRDYQDFLALLPGIEEENH